MAGPNHVFTPEVSAQLRRIELSTRGLVESLFSGEYHSVFKGRGLEFSDVREYQPGDDVRAIDWNVTARRGRPFIKEFVEERQLTALVIVDLSASKSFGTGEKSNALIASEIAAILALAATSNNDRIGLLLVTDHVEHFVPPDTGRRHALRMVLELLAFEPHGRTTVLSAGLSYADKVLRQRTTVFLVSDFLVDESADPDLSHAIRRLAWDHDLVPIRLTDPRTYELPDVGLLSMVDPEHGLRRVVNTADAEVRREYRIKAEEQRKAVDDTFRDLQLDAVNIDTTDDYLPPLIGFFRQRARAAR
jgi:uncharacterized protein (DUF58 family)